MERENSVPEDRQSWRLKRNWAGYVIGAIAGWLCHYLSM